MSSLVIRDLNQAKSISPVGFFAQHPEHSQAQRFIQEYRDLVADASALPNRENDDEGGISNDGC